MMIKFGAMEQIPIILPKDFQDTLNSNFKCAENMDFDLGDGKNDARNMRPQQCAIDWLQWIQPHFQVQHCSQYSPSRFPRQIKFQFHFFISLPAIRVILTVTEIASSSGMLKPLICCCISLNSDRYLCHC